MERGGTEGIGKIVSRHEDEAEMLLCCDCTATAGWATIFRITDDM